jgi:hypothetical protein
MAVKTDCFAYDEETFHRPTCRALNGLYCKKEECKFYKTAKQACTDCTYTDCRNCIVADKKYKLK